MTIQQHASFDSSGAELNATSKLVKAWESKNAKNAARAGGVSLMALSLAACGGSSEEAAPTVLKTVYDAAVTAKAAAEAEAAAAATAQTAAETAQAAAEATAAAAATAQTAAETAQTAAEADAATAATAQAAAETAQAAAEADAATAATAQAAAETAQAAAEAAQAAAATAQAAAETALATQNTAITAAGFADVDALITAYTSLITPTSFAATIAADVPTMSSGNDSVTATSATYNAGDIIADGSTADNDTLTITATGDVTALATVLNIENVNINLEAFGAAGGAGAATTFEVEAANIGATTFNIDVTQAGSSIAAFDIDDIATGSIVNTSTDFTAVTVAADDNASYVANVGGAAAATVVTFTDNGTTADDLTVNSTSALTVAATAADGDLSFTSAGDMIITDADSGATLTAVSTGGSVTVTTADTSTSLNITSSDETVVTGATGATAVTVSALGTGVAASNTTASTITATAATTLDISGNGGALVANAAGSTLLSTVTVSGSQDVTLQTSGANLTAARSLNMTDTSTGTSVLELTAQGTTVDLVDVAVDTILLSADMNADDIDVASGASIQVGSTQTSTTFDGVAATAASNTVTVTVNDDATANTSYAFATLVDFDNFATVNLVLSDTSEAAAGVAIAALDAGTATVNLSGVADADINGGLTAGAFDASTSTGAIAIDLVGVATVATVTTGSGDDTIVQNTQDLTTGGYTISTNAGDDSITLLASADSTVDGGDGSDTVALNGDYRAVSLSLTSVETLDVDTDATNTNMFVDSSTLTGGTFIVTDSTNGDSDLHINMDAFALDLSSLTVDSTTVGAMVVDGSTFGAAGGLTITGSSIADEVTSGASGDVISTGAGNDIITDSGAGDDNIDTGAGDDTVTDSGTGADTINTGAGDDTITDSGTGADIIDMGAGDDTLTDSGAGADTIDMGAGDDTVTDAGAGNDTITLGLGSDTVDAGTGADIIILTEATSAADDVIYGAQGDGSAVGAAAGTFTGFDVITGFASGTDDIDVTAIDTADANFTIVAQAAAASSSNDLADADFDDVDALVSFFNDTTMANSAFVATNAGVTVDAVAITFSDFTAIYVIDDAATDGIAAAEIELLATVDDILVAGDIIG